MKEHYMLDTNICSYLIKKSDSSIRKHLLETPMSTVFISVITEAELLFGLTKLPDNHALNIAVQEFLARINILTWDSATANQYAHLRADLSKIGKSLGNMDLMIAAHALSVNATLVSHDQVFRMVEKLKWVDWTI